MELRVLESFKDLLSDLKSQAIEAEKKGVQGEANQGDPADIAQHQIGNHLQTQVAERNALYLKRINAALNRIRSGSFGKCTECEEPIEEQRLRARPITTLCVSCKEDEEKFQSGFARTRKRSA